MADKSPTFRVDEMLAEEGMSFSRRGEDGSVYVIDPAGKEARFDMDGLKAELAKEAAQAGKKLSVDKINFEFNNPDSAMEISPLGPGQRTEVKAFGNTRGSINYLKKQFKDVVYHPDKGLVVNNDGVWQTVDPAGLGEGDAWQKTKELWKDVVDNQDIAIAGLAGAGAMALAPIVAPAAVAAAPLLTTSLFAGGGAALSGAIRTTMGRMLGTYEAGPVETMSDVGLETIMGMAGQAAAPGIKMRTEQLIDTGKFFMKHATDAGKELVAETYGMITGVGSPAMRALFTGPAKMVGMMKGLVDKAGPTATYENIRAEAIKESVNDITTIAEAAHGALPKRYGKYIDELMEQAGAKGFVADMEQIGKNVMEEISALGLGKFVPKVSKGGLKARAAMEQAGRQMPNPVADLKKGLVEFVPHTIDEANSLMAQGINAVGIEDKEVLKTLKPLVNNILAMSKQGKLEGRQGAKAIVEFQKNINRIKDAAFKAKNPDLERLTMASVNGFEKGVAKAFDDVGLGAKYAEKSALYGQYANAAKVARNIVRDATDGEKAEALLKMVVSPADKRVQARGTVGLMVDLAGDMLGEKAQQTYEKVFFRDAASKFAAWRPRFGPVGNLTGVVAASTGGHALTKGVAAAGNAVAGAPGAALALGGAAAQFSPRAVANQFRLAANLPGQIRAGGRDAAQWTMSKVPPELAQKALPYAMKAMDLVKSLPIDKARELVGDDRALGLLLGQTYKAFQGEDAATKELLSKAGL